MLEFTIKNNLLMETTVCPDIFISIHPDDTEKTKLISMGLTEHSLTSALDPDEPARIEFDETDYTTILFKIPKTYSANDKLQFSVSSMGVFLFTDKIIIISSEDIQYHKNIKVHSIIGLILKITSRVVVQFREHLKAIQAVSNELQNNINVAVGNQHLISLFTLQKSLVYYFDSINSNGFVLERIKTKLKLKEDEVENLDETIIDNAQCCKQAEIYSNILASLMDARASIISNNLNVLMKTLNVITISLMVPTLVVSAFSMNVPIPQSEHWITFYAILAAASVCSLGFIRWWKRNYH